MPLARVHAASADWLSVRIDEIRAAHAQASIPRKARPDGGCSPRGTGAPVAGSRMEEVAVHPMDVGGVDAPDAAAATDGRARLPLIVSDDAGPDAAGADVGVANANVNAKADADADTVESVERAESVESPERHKQWAQPRSSLSVHADGGGSGGGGGGGGGAAPPARQGGASTAVARGEPHPGADTHSVMFEGRDKIIVVNKLDVVERWLVGSDEAYGKLLHVR